MEIKLKMDNKKALMVNKYNVDGEDGSHSFLLLLDVIHTGRIDPLRMVSWTEKKKKKPTLLKKAHTSGEGWTYSRTGASVLK